MLCLSLTIVMVANMSLNLALPAIARDLDASTTALQWMVDAYALVFAGLLFTTGTLGDRFGRGRCRPVWCCSSSARPSRPPPGPRAW